jgi:dihydrofolate synthase/folylpolyglutamate synthase
MSGLIALYPKFGAGPCLKRVAAAADMLGVDLAAFGAKAAVIVGSNGKGSTAAMTAAILEHVDPRVGLFTSPHLLRVNERFRFAGVDISDEELAAHSARVAAVIARCEARHGACFGLFEVFFLIAADWFSARGGAFTVWEAGIGGRLDPVRLINARRIALTSLDFEHTALLGDTLEAIARDKLDAAPEGAIAFIGAGCAAQRPAIEAHCKARRLQAVFVDERALGDIAPPLIGAFQRHNAALAVSVARDLAPLSDATRAAGIAKTRWPGRLEILQHNPLVVIDVGHTPQAVAAALREFHATWEQKGATLICGASADKDVAALVTALAPGFQSIICTRAAHKGAPVAQIAAYARAANPSATVLEAETVSAANALVRRSNGAVYVAGSLFLAAEFRALRLGHDPRDIAFV